MSAKRSPHAAACRQQMVDLVRSSSSARNRTNSTPSGTAWLPLPQALKIVYKLFLVSPPKQTDHLVLHDK